MVQLCDCQCGDIIKIGDTIVVLVENNCDDGYIHSFTRSIYCC